MHARYRGFDIEYVDNGYQLHEDGYCKETHTCIGDDVTKRYKAMERIDAIHRHRRLEIDANIQRVDAQVKATRDSGV